MPGIVMPVLSEDELERILEWGQLVKRDVRHLDWTMNDHALYEKLESQYRNVACKVER